MRKRTKCQFIEQEASEGYSSEEEDDPKFEINRKEAERQLKEIQSRRAQAKERLNKRLQELMEQDAIDETQNNSDYSSNVNDQDDEDQDDDDDDDTLKGGPKLNDPKVWRFKCGRSILEVQRILEISNLLPKNSPIVSVFYTPNVKGFIFFESFFENDVKEFMRSIMYGQPIYIQPEDCDSLLEIKKNNNIQVGQWVRFKNHKNYGKDLGKVLRVNLIQNFAIIKVIKRNKQGQKEPISWQRTRQQTNQIETTNQSEFIYSDIEKEYKCAKIDGFNLLRCPLKNIEHNITITDEELQMFFPDVVDRKILVQQAKREILRRVDVQFKEGQKVRLIGEDDLNKGPKFKIMKIFDDQMIELMCKKDNREYTYLVHASEIRLAFKLYQEAKVIDGPHKGDVGVIICIKQGYVVLSNQHGTFKVPHSVLQFGYKNFQTDNSLVKFGNNDFQIGCVIQQKLQSAVVLDINNEVQEIRNEKLEILTINGVEMNEQGETFRINDNVIIISGQYANKFGLVKHCINGKLYLFNHLFPYQIILESANNCKMVFSKQNKPKQNDQMCLTGQICQLKIGQWQGYRGQIVQIKSGYLIVQLSANNTKVKVSEKDILLL
ncbi:unnamed protein product [Paramecium octaurelia]|uniref:KOW domain-containing protein n=1 Tax=Paramecium octaurelia TaxID=43137 RepID=A0A8S1UW35_PAROT|nr:unnamed protein product [Paramecium octaurelia]